MHDRWRVEAQHGILPDPSAPNAHFMSPHLLIVHFPIAFIALAAVVDILGTALKDPPLRDWGWRLLMMGALAGFLAFATGEGARMSALGAGVVETSAMESHQLWGSVGIWALAGAALLRTLWRHRSGTLFVIINLMIMVAAAAITVAITVLGTLIRHG
jgi:uncharacterized membrane protein